MDKEQISRYVGKLCQQKLHMAADGLSIRDFDLYVAPSTAQPTRHSSLRLICRVSDDTDEFGLGMYITGLVPAQTCLLRDPVLVAVRSTNPNVTSSDLRRALMVKLFQQGYLTPKSARFRQDIRNVYDIVTPRLEAMTETEFCMINQLKAELNTRPVCSVWRQALLSDSCLINHSCAPNTKMIMRPISKEAVFISLQRLKDGNEVTISYIPFPIDCKSSRALLLGLTKLQAKEAASIEKDCEKLVAKLIKTTAANAKKGRMLTVVGVASRRSVWGTTNFAHMHRALERLKQIGLRATCWSTRDKQVAWRVDAAYEYCIVVDLGTH